MSNAEQNSGMKIRNVYHSLDSVLAIFKKEEYASLREVHEILDIFHKNYKPNVCKGAGDGSRNHFIVLEGLDCSGKTTVAKELVIKLKGERVGTPPEIVKHLRSKFDAHPVPLRRAYYALGNYLAGQEVDDLRKNSSVIMDRFWHSTAVYTIATELDEAGLDASALKDLDASVFWWPRDLFPVPDAVFYLTVNEETRLMRQSRRQLSPTNEEQHMGASARFRTLLEETYRQMKNPAIVEVDSNRKIPFVVDDILEILKRNQD